MRNIAHTGISSIIGLKSAGKGLNREVSNEHGKRIPNPIYISYHDKKNELEVAYKEYDSFADPCKLEELSPMSLTDYQKGGLKELYNRERPFLMSLWEEVAYVDKEFIMCPLCGQQVVKELDHYIPRARMPEYSVHLLNLIPTCHECNLDKGDKWLGADGKRVIFNAYFDKIDNLSQLLKCEITINESTANPRAVVSVDKVAATTMGEIGRLVQSTYDNVESIREQWSSKANNSLKNQIRVIESSVKVRKHHGQYDDGNWNNEKEIIQETIASLLPYEFIEKVVYERMLSSEVFNDWIIGDISALFVPVEVD